MATLTVFTPAYNRAHTIGRTYASMCRQTCKDFEWLIIDDGSSDNTRELVEGWIAEGKVPIRYIYQQNQGMHGAHNTAYRNIDTPLNTCIDSDDYMPDDAVEKILKCWQEKGSDKVAGLVGLDVTEDGQVIGTGFPELPGEILSRLVRPVPGIPPSLVPGRAEFLHDALEVSDILSRKLQAQERQQEKQDPFHGYSIG